MFLLGAAYTLKKDEHVRIDVLASRYSERAQVWGDIVGILLFMFPACILILWYSIGAVEQSILSDEHSGNSPLVLWPFKLLIPLGFLMLLIQFPQVNDINGVTKQQALWLVARCLKYII